MNKKIIMAFMVAVLFVVSSSFVLASTILLDEHQSMNTPGNQILTNYGQYGPSINISTAVAADDMVIVEFNVSVWNGDPSGHTFNWTWYPKHATLPEPANPPIYLYNETAAPTGLGKFNISFTGVALDAGSVYYVIAYDMDYDINNRIRLLQDGVGGGRGTPYADGGSEDTPPEPPSDWNPQSSYRAANAINILFRAWVITEEAESTANESEGRTAIEQGINASAITGATVYTDYQTGMRDLDNYQAHGTFDKYAIYGNQRWPINYKTGAETFTDLRNLTDTLIVLEFENMTTAQIKLHVENAINDTKT